MTALIIWKRFCHDVMGQNKSYYHQFQLVPPKCTLCTIMRGTQRSTLNQWPISTITTSGAGTGKHSMLFLCLLSVREMDILVILSILYNVHVHKCPSSLLILLNQFGIHFHGFRLIKIQTILCPYVLKKYAIKPVVSTFMKTEESYLRIIKWSWNFKFLYIYIIMVKTELICYLQPNKGSY